MTLPATIPQPSETSLRLRALARRIVREKLTPPENIGLPEWSDRFRIVPNYSAEPGPWQTEKTPYLRGIMEAMTDPTINRVVFMKCSRIGATECGLNAIGYFIDHDPSSIFIVQPTVEDAKDFSKEQLTPTIENTDCLRQKIRAASSRDSGNTIQAKLFDGGALYLVGANSPRGFRRRTARVIFCEEVDAYPPSAGTEGDQVRLAERRATTYQHRRKIYINSSPTLKGLSRIEAEYEATDQRRYFVECPLCSHSQVLVWAQLRYKDLPAPAYECVGCKQLIAERYKVRLVASGSWRATATAVPGTVGFHINALYSPFITWSELVREWHDAQNDPGKLQVFVNTALGETWEDKGSLLGAEGLAGRREPYDAVVPLQVQGITMGVDVQPDRIEAVTRGWGLGEESWLIERVIFLGDVSLVEESPASPWGALEKYRTTPMPKSDGSTVKIGAVCIDSGYHPEAVYRWAKPRYSERVFVTRGYSQPGKPLVARRPSVNNKARCRVFYVGTDAAKDAIYGLLKIGVRGPLYWHFPIYTDRDYFEQLTSENRIVKQVGGRLVSRYELMPNRRNEVLDCEVGNLVALRLWKPSFQHLQIPEKRDPVTVTEPAPSVESVVQLGVPPELIQPQPVAPRRMIQNLRPKRGGFVNRY
jgi:phage terminase large subunit GpA-like protein